MNILIFIYFGIMFINIITCLIKLKNFNRLYLAFTAFAIYTFLNEFFSWDVTAPFPKLTPYLYNIYFVMSIGFWSYYCYQTIHHQTIRQVIIFICSLILLFCIYTFFNNGVANIQNQVSVCLAILFFIYPLLYLYSIFNHVTEYSITSSTSFWVLMGGFLWSIVYLFYAGPMYYLYDHFPNLNRISYIILNIINLLCYSFFQIGLLHNREMYKTTTT